MIQLNEKYNKGNHYELKSLGWSAVKFTSAGSHGMLLLCHNRDRQVSLVVFIAAVMSLRGLYSFYVPLPLIHQCDEWEWEPLLVCRDLPAMGADSIELLACYSGALWPWMAQAPTLNLARQPVNYTGSLRSLLWYNIN